MMPSNREDEPLRSTCFLCRKLLKEAQTSEEIVYIKDSDNNEITLEYIVSSACGGCPLCTLFLAATVYKGDEPADLNMCDIDEHISTVKAKYKGLEVGFGIKFYVPSLNNSHKLERVLNLSLVAHLVGEDGQGHAYTHNYVLQACNGTWTTFAFCI